MTGGQPSQRWSVVCLALVITCLAACSSATSHTSQPDCAEKHGIAIVGAGIAGAYSAYKLRNEGLNIGIYEYSDRIGGRYHTEQLPNTPDLNLELGGMRLVDGLHHLLQDLVRDLGLTERVLLYGDDQEYEERVFRRGVSMTASEFSTGDVPYNLTQEEKANQADLLPYMLRKLTNDSLENVTEHNLFDLTVPDGRKLYELSAPEALEMVASPEGLAYLLTGSDYNSEEISAADMVFETMGPHGNYSSGDELTVVEGFMEIVNRTVQAFLRHSSNHSLELNMKLLSIRGRPGNYRLKFRRTVTVDDATMELHGRHSESTVCASRVILALPKFGLSQVDWKPLNSRRYRELMAGTFLVHASKVFLTYGSPWWLEEARFPARRMVASGLGQVYDWGQSNVTGDWVLLVSYTNQVATDRKWVSNRALNDSLLEDSIGGKLDLDEDFAILEEPDALLPRIPGSVYGENRVTAPLRDYLHKHLGRAFGIPRCGIPDPISSIARFWIQYPYGGGWVWVRPGYRYDELIEGFRRPSVHDDVFVVGTDYSARDTIGWAEGALWTVDRVIERFF